MLAIRDYEQAPYLVLATRNGLVKKTRLGDYNSPRQAGVIAINFREDDDELIGAELVNPDDDILLVSRKGQAIRFRADDSQLRPMGRATSGVTGMKFRDGDSMLSMSVIRAEQVAAEEAAEAGWSTRARHPRTSRPVTCPTSRSSTSSRSPTAASPSGPRSPTTACSPAAGSGSRPCTSTTSRAATWSERSSSRRATRSCRSRSPDRSSGPDRREPPAARPVHQGRRVRDACKQRRRGRRRRPFGRGQGRRGGAAEEQPCPTAPRGRCRGDHRRIAGCGPGCNNRGIAG